jgi:hypothetical protein
MNHEDIAVPIGRLPLSPDGPVDQLRSDPRYCAWSQAHEASEWALQEWFRTPGRESYLRFRSAADREDCAQDALAAARGL